MYIYLFIYFDGGYLVIAKTINLILLRRITIFLIKSDEIIVVPTKLKLNKSLELSTNALHLLTPS